LEQKDNSKQQREIQRLRQKLSSLENLIARQASELKDLRVSEKRLQMLFEFAPDAYYLNDLKGNFVDGNRAAAELLGYQREELIGKNFLKYNKVKLIFL